MACKPVGPGSGERGNMQERREQPRPIIEDRGEQLVANPLRGFSDALLEDFIECSLFESEAGDDASTGAAAVPPTAGPVASATRSWPVMAMPRPDLAVGTGPALPAFTDQPRTELRRREPRMQWVIVLAITAGIVAGLGCAAIIW